MKKTKTQLHLASRNEIKNIMNHNPDQGIIKSLLEKYKPSKQIRILEDRPYESQEKIAA